MIDLAPYKYFYFLGVGGIGMSALARYFKFAGFEVAGYDRTRTELTDMLEEEGIFCHFDDNIEAIPAHFLSNKAEMLVIYTPAIPKEHREFNYMINGNYTMIKRAEALASVTNGKETIAVAGTHGKTSTASMISHILRTADVPFYAFLGGIAANYNTNFLAPENGDEADLIIVEADEFDRSFLQLEPDIIVITAIESDHLDIYDSEENLKDAFKEFAKKIKPHGALIIHNSIRMEVPENETLDTYGIDYKGHESYADGEYKAENIKIEDGKYHYDFVFPNPEYRLNDLTIGVPGIHNIENSMAAIAATHHLYDDDSIVYKALETFRGVHRRFEVIYKGKDVVYIDDYAHHPTEIKVTLQTIRDLYPAKKLLGIFQPHLYSRTRDLADDFAKSLSMLDELILLPIYPAREEPIPGVSSSLILDKATCDLKSIINRDEVVNALNSRNFDVIVTLGAGDIDRLVKPIKLYLEQIEKDKIN